MLRENRVKRALWRGEVVVGTMVQEMRNPCVAQVLASAGLDFFMIDMEHGNFALQTVADIVQVARLSGIMPFARVPDDDYPWLTRPLDAGIMGLMVPRIRSRAQVEAIVQAIKYPPVGQRGCGGLGRQTEFDSVPVDEWIPWANGETLLILQIEQQEAIENIDDILGVAGVDVALIGPNDLSISLGLPGQRAHPTAQAAWARVVAAAARHGVASGLHIGDTDLLRTWRDKGMRMLMCDRDIGLMQKAAHQVASR